ncbi:hypothetical protein [Pseudonocardia nigra]|uniref:hypothetical protein n=1 Tax=Pseudonocardia nigra TaxID=1921578 RepID=UPI001C5EF2F3|nr:hypothetical protein [Pseudonocardia nigra]
MSTGPTPHRTASAPPTAPAEEPQRRDDDGRPDVPVARVARFRRALRRAGSAARAAHAASVPF